MRPRLVRITEANPRLRRLHVVGEVHPGELAERGYRRDGEGWVLEVRRPEAGDDVDPVVREFQALADLGYDFAAGDEWSPLELYRKWRDQGRLRGDKP